MHTHRCVLIEISIEIGMLNFLLGLLVTALVKETYFNPKTSFVTGASTGILWENIDEIFSEFFVKS